MKNKSVLKKNWPARIYREETPSDRMHIFLSQIDQNSLDIIATCNQDEAIRRFICVGSTDDHKSVEDWFFTEYLQARNQIFYAINVGKTQIGYCSVVWTARDIVEVGIAIGPGYRGEDFGYESLGILCGACFQRSIRKVQGKIMPDNTVALNLVGKLGFQVEGNLRKDILHQGSYKDVILVAVFKEELKYGRKVLA